MIASAFFHKEVSLGHDINDPTDIVPRSKQCVLHDPFRYLHHNVMYVLLAD